jgi:hypothetical protein
MPYLVSLPVPLAISRLSVTRRCTGTAAYPGPGSLTWFMEETLIRRLFLC